MNLSAAPGECYNYDIKRGIQRLAIQLHLATVLRMWALSNPPLQQLTRLFLAAMFLAAFQFLPVIRHKILTLHRVDGYIIIVFMTVAHVCALILGRGSFEGAIDTQTAVGIMVTTSLISMYLALYNIKRLQIEEHRAWMLRSFFYVSGQLYLCGKHGQIFNYHSLTNANILFSSGLWNYYRATRSRLRSRMDYFHGQLLLYTTMLQDRLRLHW